MLLRLSSFRPPKKFLRASLLCLALGLSACSNNNVEEFQTEGQKLMKEGNPNGAIVFFKNALDEDANNFSLRLDLVKAYIQANKYPQAEIEINKCLLQEPNNVELLQTAANFYTILENNQKALEYVEILEKIQKPTTLSRELAASNYRAMGRLSEAEEAYKAALALDPQSIVSQINLTSLYLAGRRFEEGRALLDKAMSEHPKNISAIQLHALLSEDMRNFPEAENAYKKIIELTPAESGPYFSLAELYFKQGKFEEAGKIYDKMRTSFPKNFQTLLLEGMIAFQAQEFDKAVQVLQESVQKYPTVNSIYYLASSLNKTGNSESALSNLRRILDVQANYKPALMLTAEILVGQNRLQEAEYELNRILKDYPEDIEAYNLLGAIQKSMGEYDKALQTYQRILDINSSIGIASVARSNIFMERNQEQSAIEELEKGIQADSDSISIRTALYNYYMKQKNYDKASEIIDEAMEIQENNPLILTMKAGIFMARQEHGEASKYLKQANDIAPAFLPSAQLLFNIYMMSSNYEEALALCNKFLEHAPENVDFLVTSAVILDTLQRPEEATERFEKASKLHSERALVSLVRRALTNNDKAKAEKYITDALADRPIAPLRSLLSSYYIQNETLEKALSVYQNEAIKNTIEGIYGRYRLYMTKKMYDEAIAEADSMITTYAQQPEGYFFKSMALEQNNNFDEAFSILENAYKITSSQQILLQLGNLCMRNNRYDKALSYFRTALLKDPNNKEALSGQSYIYTVQNDYQKAIEGYEKILEKNPNDQATLNNLAMVYAEEGINTARAVELATKTFLTSPENESILDTYAFTLLQNKQTQESINILQGGLRSNPNSGQLHYRHGLALLANEQIAEAVAAFEKAVELGGFSEIEKAKGLIDANK